MNYKKLLGAAGAALMVVIIVTLVLAPGAWAASKYKTLYKFKGGKDGWDVAGVILDSTGNIYGTTRIGGAYDRGTVFKLTPTSDGGWKESVLHNFCSLTNCRDGQEPEGGLTFDSAGNLYGTATEGGTAKCNADGSCGVVFKLTPNSDGSWTESVLYSFSGGKHGSFPWSGLVFDQTGNLYGTTANGGNRNSLCWGFNYSCGVVFQLTPNPDGSWTESGIYDFCSLTNCADGSLPRDVIFDSAGNLYGTTASGGTFNSSCGSKGCGVVFKLTPTSAGWTESVLHSFSGINDGGLPWASLTLDAAGNLYGTADPVAFELTPKRDGSWTEKVLYGLGDFGSAALTFDGAGNLYGTTQNGGPYRYGVVFKLAPNSKGGWSYDLLHSFMDRPGAYPSVTGRLIFDGAGNLYGTTVGDGTTTFGSVFEITP